MKVALIHDYIGEFGGAERVLLALSGIYPEAPIFTAFSKKGLFLDKLKDRDIRTSWAQKIPFFSTKLHSPLRFLAPLIWGSFKKELQDFDLIISSASWYVTKGFGQGGLTIGKPIEICYCHTPPRYLYGYETSIKPSWLVNFYATIVNPFMRYYDFVSAQKVDYFIANSKNVAKRINKFYRREAEIIYPPVALGRVSQAVRGDYYLVVARIVGAKGIEMAIQAANKLGFKLKIAGEAVGYSSIIENLKKQARDNTEFLGYVNDLELVRLYREAKAFLALARDEDFGITPVEAMQAGTPVIAYKGGGYLETVIEGETGTFFENYDVEDLISAIERLDHMRINPVDCKKQGEKFSKDRFKKEIKEFVESKVKG